MARRVNTRFVGILGAAAAGVVGAVVAAQKLLIHESPDQYVSAAKEAEAAHQWKEAVLDWSKAASLSPRDPALANSLGLALHNRAREDVEVQRRELDRQAWERAWKSTRATSRPSSRW